MDNLILASSSACSALQISPPGLFGSTITSLTASAISNFSLDIPSVQSFHHPDISVQNATFCNLTVTYAHPGLNDTINVEVRLPMDGWNGRLQAVGGGGYSPGRGLYISEALMAAAIGEGYATVVTDAGLGINKEPEDWALSSRGNLNLNALNNFASRSLYDEVCQYSPLLTQFTIT